MSFFCLSVSIAIISQDEFIEGALNDEWIREMLECDPSIVKMERPLRISLKICRRQSVCLFYQARHEYKWSDVVALNATVSDSFNERVWGCPHLSPTA